MISYFNYEINYNINEKNRITKLNNNINKNIKIEKPLPNNKIRTNKKFNTIINNNFSLTNQYKLYINPSFIINIVYQYKYKYDKSVTGLGDFIRGIFFILQFTEKYNIKYELNINNHIIKKYLYYFCNKPNISEEISRNIHFFDRENYIYELKNNIIEYKYIDIDNNFLNFLSNIDNFDNNKYLYLINHPNQKFITDNHRKIVQDIMKPTNFIYNLIEIALNNLKLLKHNFITIHIRTFDTCFSNNESLDINKNIKFLLDFIQKIYLEHKLDIFILSSDNTIKWNIIKYFKNVKFIIHNITHICIDNNDEEGIINTLKDFYIMSYSKYIYSFSVYIHGSGFSKWCATTYNIPYICYSLQK